MSQLPLIFPPTLAIGDQDRPVIVFKAISRGAKNDTHIIFPIPQALQFSDSAAYGTNEVGFSGSIILNAGRAAGGLDASFKNVVNQVQSSLPSDFNSLAGFIGSETLSGGNRSAVGVATGTTLNKNIVTEFSGVGTRQFTFQFKLISGSAVESNTIRDIINTFRAGLYPEGNSLQLKYPPTWTINFTKGKDEISYIPKIFGTYLTTMSTAYNNSMNLFHEDGSPVEVDLQVTFMETRALTLADIKSLEKDPYKDGDFYRVIEADKDLLNKGLTAATSASALAKKNK